MGQHSTIAAGVSNPPTAGPCGKSRTISRSSPAVMQKARALFPRKTAAHLVGITGYSLRSCEAWLAGETQIPGPAIAALLHCEWGLEFLVALMGTARPPWWLRLLRVGATASVLRRRAADRRLLETALEADRDLAAAIARAETALSVQDEDFHRPFLDALGAIAGPPDRAVAAAGGKVR